MNIMAGRVALCGLLLLGGCAGMPGSTAGLDTSIDEKLTKFCPIPTDTPDNRLKRARVILSAIAGYGYRSTQNYSSQHDAKDDAMRILGRLTEANTAIDVAKAQFNGGMFPVYRADMVIELGEAAAAALQPTLRASRGLITASVSDRLEFTKKALVAFLEDQLYLAAYYDACKNNFATLTDSEALDRYRLRCRALAAIGGLNGAAVTAACP